MRTNPGWILGVLLAAGLAAQPALAQTAAVPATNAPAKPAAKKPAKPAPKKKNPAAELRTVPLIAGPATVIASNVNIRGQAKLRSEILGKVNKGQTVTVIAEVTLKNSGPDEPSAWAKIVAPSGVKAWVNTSFINASNSTVLPRKLNLRTGAGENYSVMGTLKRGDVVKTISTKNDWTEIEPPADSYAFIAAQYLKQEPAGTTPVTPVATTTPPAPPDTNTPPVAVTEPPTTPVGTDPTAPPPPTLPPPADTNQAGLTLPAVTETNLPPPEPLPPRIVDREGIVRGMTSIQAPSRFVLISPDNGKAIDYLYTPSRELDLSRYKGMHIIVTGEEALDDRWGNTPVITIQKIHVLE